ncbi:hypothetical protein MKW98_001412 [Papaver atlanticum]|uniref:Uncharacterized protein n=1 Tax=Papaver atlanticum TaxID=357466 RepID=A0AAD4XN32_9MAGN|nr:hypothetical protein MKW98_001412 [Papaver atlanticum]
MRKINQERAHLPKIFVGRGHIEKRTSIHLSNYNISLPLALGGRCRWIDYPWRMEKVHVDEIKKPLRNKAVDVYYSFTKPGQGK